MTRTARTFCMLILPLFAALALTPRAHSQQLYGAACTPADCQDNYGPSTTGSAGTSIVGYCSPSTETDTISQGFAITIIKPCVSPVILETSADSGNQQYLPDFWICVPGRLRSSLRLSNRCRWRAVPLQRKRGILL